MHAKSALASLLLVSAVQGHAQSLGAAQGAVIIGRPLDIVVQSQVGTTDDAASLCVQADVRYGDARLSPSEVSVTVEQGGAAGQGALRVRARQPINEPFVTVELRIGCPTRFSRSYTLLADAEPIRPAPAVAPARPAVTAPVTQPPAPSVVPRPVTTAPAPTPMTRSMALSPETPIRLQAPLPRPAGVTRLASKARPVPAAAPVERQASGQARPVAESAPSAPGPRLELEPVDLGNVPPTTVPAPESVSAPAGAAAPSATEGAPPAAPASEVAPAVQEELSKLRAEQQRLLMAVESLNRELTAAREGRADGLLYGLAGAALVLLGVVLWLLRRRPAVTAVPTEPWWAAPGAGSAGASNSAAAAVTGAVPAETAAVTAGASDQPSAAGAASPPAALPDADHMAGLEVSEAGASVFQEVPVAALDFGSLHELWERVDFFESLGQAGDAIAALRAFVQAHPRASEAPYLRWWALANRHGLDTRLPQATYEQHFQRLLVGDGPGGGLEADAPLMADILRDWPGDAVRTTIEAALASQPGDPSGGLHIRSLTAFDDLIVLHGVLDLLPVLAQAPAVVATPPDAGPSVLDFELPDIADLSLPAAPPKASPAPDAAAPGKPDEVLDFDLSGWQPPTDKPLKP